MQTSLYNALYYTGASKMFHWLNGQGNAIISYHNVLPVPALPTGGRYKVDTTAAILEKHLAFLSQKFRILPFPRTDVWSARGLLISVDDGLLNNYEVLLPLLDKYQVKAMFAICPDGIEGRIPHFWQDHLFLLLQRFSRSAILLPINGYSEPYQVHEGTIVNLQTAFKEWVVAQKISDVYSVIREICQRNDVLYQKMPQEPQRFQFMSWDQIRELHRQGHIIASHTLSHRILSLLSDKEKLQELKHSREEIADHIKAPVSHIVYPYGGPEEVDAGTIALAEKAGYQWGFLNVQQKLYGNHPLALPRFGLPRSTHIAQLHVTTTGLVSYIKRKVYSQ